MGKFDYDERFCENELHTYYFQLDTGEILCCKCELPKKHLKTAEL